MCYGKNPLLVSEKYMETFLQELGCALVCPYADNSCQGTASTSYKMFLLPLNSILMEGWGNLPLASVLHDRPKIEFDGGCYSLNLALNLVHSECYRTFIDCISPYTIQKVFRFHFPLDCLCSLVLMAALHVTGCLFSVLWMREISHG